VRSAAYNLGALQSLDRAGVLRNAEYLAAVSGGAYTAAAFAMVGNTRAPDGSDPDLLTPEHGPFHRGSPEEQYLRNRASYLAPGPIGKVFLVQRVLAGLAFNLLFIGLFLAALAMVLTAFCYVHGYTGLTQTDAASGFHVPRWYVLVPAIIAAAGVLLAFVSVLVQFSSDEWRAVLETWCARLLLMAGALALFSIALPGLVAVARELELNPGGGDNALPGLTGTGAAGIVTVIAGVLLQLSERLSDPATVLEQIKPWERRLRSLGRGLRMAFIYFAGAVAGPGLLLAILVAVTSAALAHSAPGTTASWIWPTFFGSSATFLILYFAADITSWSLHPFYKRRLCTAFALKRIADPDDPAGKAVERDYDTLVPLSKTGFCAGWPTLIVCAAANISDTAATPPGRSVTSFTFSCETVGGPLVGGVDTRDYERRFDHKRLRYMTLPSAVAMSGAALSPSMGKMTRRPLTFLMVLANIRLGVWVPNPQRLDDWERSYRLRQALRRLTGVDRVPSRSQATSGFVARPRPSYLVREMLGLNHVTARHLYVTDGGHYENLGLVELLRRGCTDIYCFDASGGSSFANLGDAIALARTELEVEIVIDPRPLVARGDRNLAERDCVRGTIKFPATAEFPDGAEGSLVYARTVMTAAAPWDVHAYHEADRTFPHDPTVDQLYTDQKFEAYRALGELAADHARRRMAEAAEAGRAAPLPAVVPPAAPHALSDGQAREAPNGGRLLGLLARLRR